MKKACIYCNHTAEYESARSYSNHVRWCKKNPNYQNIYQAFKEKISINSAKKTQEKYEANPVLCKRCNEKLDFSDYKKERTYCQKPLCRKFARMQPSKIMAEKRQNFQKQIQCSRCCCSYFCNLHSRKNLCQECKINIKLEKQKQKEIEKENRIKNVKDLLAYRRFCHFAFDVYKFPQEFDLTLLEKHGWYQPANKGNNLYGVAKDHMYSVKNGFSNKIDPKIISHPANCRLLLQSDNARKYSDCSITLEQLLHRIAEWDRKYMGC